MNRKGKIDKTYEFEKMRGLDATPETILNAASFQAAFLLSNNVRVRHALQLFIANFEASFEANFESRYLSLRTKR